MIAPPVCHGPPTSRCQAKRTVAPCGGTIRNCTAKHVGDSWSASLRFINCKKCRQQLRGLGKAKASDVDMIPAVRQALLSQAAPPPWVIENVVGAPLQNAVTLCGSMFGLAVRRHRLFEASFPIVPPPCSCRGRRNIAVYGKAPGHRLPDGVIRARSLAHGRRAMGIRWMAWPELTQAIPPAYAGLIGRAALHARKAG